MKPQTIGNLYANLTELLKKGVSPDTPLVSASDEEGNSFNFVYYSPTLGFYKDMEFYQEKEKKDAPKGAKKVLCVN